MLRSLALKGRRFETWAEIKQAVERATAYWNQHIEHDAMLVNGAPEIMLLAGDLEDDLAG